MNTQGEGDSPSGHRTATDAHAVLVCQACPYVWEAAQTDGNEFAAE